MRNIPLKEANHHHVLRGLCNCIQHGDNCPCRDHERKEPLGLKVSQKQIIWDNPTVLDTELSMCLVKTRDENFCQLTRGMRSHKVL